MSWLDQLAPASWRGVPFQIRVTQYGAGRRVAVHEYPDRDTVWVEDMGRAPRPFAFSAFVVGDDCFAQAQTLMAACEAAGIGTLVHPSLGEKTVALVSPARMRERFDLGRVVEIELEFLESSDPFSPSAEDDTAAAAEETADDADVAVADDFASSINEAIDASPAAAEACEDVAGLAADAALSFAIDVLLAVNAVAGLGAPLWTYGRYFNGRRSTLLTGVSNADGALSAVLTAQDQVAAAGAAVRAARPAGLASPIQTMTEAVRAACHDPADAVRLLSGLAGFAAAVLPSSSTIGSAIADARNATSALVRRAALTSLARACAEYAPSSYDDATSLREQVSSLFDAEILRAADGSPGQAYMALQRLRAAVVADLVVRGAQLPRLRTVTTQEPLPALVLAYRLYEDASRADEMITRADPPHPSLMPTEFEALSS